MLSDAKSLKDLIKGNEKFKNTHFPKLEKQYGSLVEHGQKPQILFIGCSDSRVVPDLIVNSKPGDMFILRNIGNFVPPYTSDGDFHGSTAAIEYAVSVLEVKDIVICGHSHCGACASLYEDLSDKKHLLHVKKWLQLGNDAKNYTINLLGKDANKDKILRTTEKASLKFQLGNLLTYPAIIEKINSGDLEVHAWYYKIEDGSIEYYDIQTSKFQNLN